MKHIAITIVLAGIVIGLVPIFCGCATGPTYLFPKQPDSATVEGFGAPNQGPEDGNCVITINRVDNMSANFDASVPGPNWPFHSPELYLAPGMHTLGLRVSGVAVEFGANSGNSAGITGAIASKATPAISVAFNANHKYRFTGAVAGSTIVLSLWDETDGPAERSCINSWILNSNSSYSNSPAPSGEHR